MSEARLFSRRNAAHRAWLDEPGPATAAAYRVAHADFVRVFCPGEAEQLIAELAERMGARDAA